MAIRVLQWTTGHVGREAVKAILAHPELEDCTVAPTHGAPRRRAGTSASSAA